MSTVIGTVIGSGIFFKSEQILNMTDGNVLWGLIVFLAGGGIMLLCAASFASFSEEAGGEGGLVGFAEKACGRGFARFTAIFSADFYLPSMTATLAYVSGGYFCRLIGNEDSDVIRIALSGALLVVFFAVNTLAPRGASRFQILSTAVKLLPLIAVGAVGCVSILGRGGIDLSLSPIGKDFMSALLASAFAYEGWIAVTALGGEVGSARKNMPAALVLGALSVLAVYVFYYFGVVGAAEGASSSIAFSNIFGESGGRIMLLFVTLSCLGALNGLTMSVVRGHYVLSQYLGRDDRADRLFGEISEKTGIPVLSGIMGLLVSEVWLLLLTVSGAQPSISLGLDPAEASISLMYALYVPILLMMTVKMRSKGVIRRFLLPLLGAIAATFIAVSAPVAYGGTMLAFCALVAAVALALLGFYRR